VVILLDEISAVPQDLRTSLFTTLRAIYNQRHDTAAPEEVARVQFVFAGTFDPQRLIESKNSPFNVAYHLDTTSGDFSLEQVQQIADAVNAGSIADEIHQATGGHPYLTNRLFTVAAELGTVTLAVEAMLQSDLNLTQLARQVAELGGDARQILDRIVAGEQFEYGLGLNSHLDRLITIGLLRETGGIATVRCPLYEAVLKRVFQFRRHPPKDSGSVLDFLEAGVLRDTAESLLKSAPLIAAISPALASASIGAAMEAVLLEELEREGDLSAEILMVNAEIKAGRLDLQPIKGNTVTTWKLAHMIEVARARRMVTKPLSQVSHGIRDWRNLIHPAKLREEFPDGVPVDVAESSISVSSTLLRELAEWRSNNPP
jgi:hypothetical protein